MSDHPTPFQQYFALFIGLFLVAALSAQVAADIRTAESAYFGTARAPNSDALAPWLHGALHFLFAGEPHGYLYRPTIGIFYGSIIAVAQRIDAVPIFFLLFFATFLVLAIAKADRDLRWVLIAWICFLVLGYESVLQPINFYALTPDGAAFVFGLIGLYFCFLAVRTAKIDNRLLSVGFLALGIAAAIRGPLMIGGPIMLSLLYGIAGRGRRARLLIPALLFLLPIVFDVAFQKAYGVMNNGIITLFCFYTDPSYSWTTPCNDRYVSLKPYISEVVSNYLNMLFSPEGSRIVIGNLKARLHQDGLGIGTRAFPVAVTALLVPLVWQIFCCSTRNTAPSGGTDMLSRVLSYRSYTLIRMFLMGATAAVAYRSGPVVLVITLSAMTLLISGVMRLYRPMLGLAVYWCGAIFLALMTQAHQDRLAFTFSFALHLAVLLCVIDRPRRQHPDFAPSPWIGATTIFVIVFLYAGVFLVPNQWKSVYDSAVKGKAVALKISEDHSLNRCLYLTGQEQMLYVRCDEAAAGPVLIYSRIEAPGGYWNGSYHKPARFIP